MAGNYNIHFLTLAQVPSLLRVEGSWPEPITITSGWFRARARPWNETITDPMIRLERGGSEFLGAVTTRMFDLGVSTVYSPALYGGSTRVWMRTGFEDHAALDIMERPLGGGRRDSDGAENVEIVTDPDWDEILEIDRLAFEGFWGMSGLGLAEAHGTSRESALFVVQGTEHLSGYAITGAQWGTVYLHRIAVRPESAGRGVGAALLAGAIAWANGVGGRSMILNVRRENERARRLYARAGFADTGSTLQVLRLRRR